MNEQIPITCPKCGGQIKYIPAGVSKKTGKPYSEFWTCGQRCGYSYNPPKEEKQPIINHEPIELKLIKEGFGLLRGEHKEINRKLDILLEGTGVKPNLDINTSDPGESKSEWERK